MEIGVTVSDDRSPSRCWRAGQVFDQPTSVLAFREMVSILIADDDPLLVSLVTFKLESRGFEVFSVSDGDAAVGKATSLRPDLIVLDAMMPRVDGFEALRRLKEHEATQAIPVIMLTARKREEDVVRGLSMGASDYVVKPFSPEELVMRIGKALRIGS